MQAKPAPSTAATETVTRPDPGLARGKWEAPVWLFWAMLGVIVVGSTFYLLRRMGLLRMPKKGIVASEASGHPSKKERQ